MTNRMEELAELIVGLQAELDREIEAHRRRFGWRASGKLITFEHGLVATHRAQREKIASYTLRAQIMTIVTAPVIYSLIIPFVLLDLLVALYQRLCFPVYGISRVTRDDYIAFDRNHLAYLNWIERLNCAYCAYANGLIAYVREVASRTEQYWCPIKHAIRISTPHERYQSFLQFGDADGYRRRLNAFRAALADAPAAPEHSHRTPA